MSSHKTSRTFGRRAGRFAEARRFLTEHVEAREGPRRDPEALWNQLAVDLGRRIRRNTSTLTFGNSRRTVEKVARLVNEHREACDPTRPDSVHWLIAESYQPDGRSLLSAEEELGLSGHFGSPAVVEEMDRICRLHFEPVDAARAIANRFGRKDGDDERPLVVRADLRPDG